MRPISTPFPRLALAACCAALFACGARGSPLAWYPSIRALVYEGAEPEGATLTVTDAADTTVYRGALTSPRQIVTLAAANAPFADGRYRATLTPAGASEPSLVKDFAYTNYPWFNTPAGRADILLPGFTPVATNGAAADVVGRRYVFGDSGLPREIWADGRQLLARPVELRGVAVPSGADFSWTSRTDTVARFHGGLASGRVEQDGLVVFDLALPETAGPVALDIALAPQYASLFHVCGDAIRSNPAGFLPDGPGRLFSSRSMKGNGMTLDNFMPYCWIGTDTRGLCYVADTDRGWVHGPDRDAVEIHREADGVVVLRLNLVAEAGRHAARHIELGLQASPVKPMPEGWRGWVDAYDVPGARNALCQPSSPTWGCYINGMARYPAFEDWSFIRQMAASAREGRPDEAALESWVARCLEARANAPHLVPWLAAIADDATAERELRNHAGAALRRPCILAGKANPVLYYYTCDYDPCETLYEMPVMADEWGSRAFVVGSHQDYAIYYLVKMCENGMSGVYNDNAFPRASLNWVTGYAWFDEQGRLHPSYGIWALREFARRQVVAMLEAGVREPWLTVHHTNANILPILSFATNTMGMEDKYGTRGGQADWQDRWPRDYIRTVNQGYQGGFFATSIEGPFHDKADRTRLTRTMLATLLPHEVQPTLSQACDTALVTKALAIRQAFGIGAPDCRYWAYYDEENPVAQADADVMVSVYRRGTRLLLVIGSYRRDAITLPLALRSGRVVSATDAETGAALPVADGAATVPLAAHGFALVELETGP